MSFRILMIRDVPHATLAIESDESSECRVRLWRDGGAPGQTAQWITAWKYKRFTRAELRRWVKRYVARKRRKGFVLRYWIPDCDLPSIEHKGSWRYLPGTTSRNLDAAAPAQAIARAMRLLLRLPSRRVRRFDPNDMGAFSL